MTDRLLVAVDGSDGGPVAMATALAVADATGASVDVLHVVDTSLSSLLSTTDRETLHERGEEILADARAQAAEADIDVETHLVEGTPSETIRTVAADCDADYIVMGRHGPHGLAERFLGSVTDAVLRHADRPVLTTCYDGPTDPADITVDTLLVPTDGSAAAEAATTDAATLAEAFGAAVAVVNAIDLAVEAGPFDAGGVSEAFVEKLEANADEAVERVVDLLHERDPDLSVTTAVERGRPHEELAAAVESEDVDLVVMGTQGHSRVSEAHLGSVTRRLLRRIDQPVLVVPPRE